MDYSITKQNIIEHKKTKNGLRLFSVYLVTTFCLFLFFIFNQTSIPLPLDFFVTLLFIFPVGYAILLPLKKFHEISAFIKIILCLSIGYLFNFMWSFFLSPFTTHAIIPFVRTTTCLSVDFQFLY